MCKQTNKKNHKISGQLNTFGFQTVFNLETQPWNLGICDEHFTLIIFV